MNIVVTGSIAFDYLMSFPGKFTDHFLPEHFSRVSLSFLVDTMDKRRGGCAPNIAYTLALLGERPRLMAAAGEDFGEYRHWLEAAGVDTSLVLQADGWTSVYLNELLVTSSVPIDVSNDRADRLRHAEGSLAIFRHVNPFTRRGLTFAQRVCSMASMLQWTTCFPKLVFCLAPPLVLFSIDRRAASLALWERAAAVAVHVLAENQKDISNRFARALANKWEGMSVSEGLHGTPLLPGVAAVFECAVWARYEGGDHRLFVLAVERFLSAPQLQQTMEAAGFRSVTYYPLHLGLISLHVGLK